MAGISDSAFRQLCKTFGADVTYTEMISADAIAYNSKKTLEMLKFDKSEKPIVAQLFGKRPEMFIKAVKMIEKAGFDGIDINFGCPARKVVAHGGGVTLMKDLEKCRELIATTIENTKLPVSVKIRAGIEKVTALDFLKAIKDLPIAAIMVHGRTFKDSFSGPIDFEMIRQVKQNFSGIVIGNGGINTPEEAKQMLDKTGVDGLGLARGLYGRPWLFQEIKDYLRNGKYHKIGTEDIKKIALQHAKIAYKSKGSHGIIEMRKHLCWYVRGFDGANELRKKLVTVETIREIKDILKHKT
ncbi:MAG: hypothetical protein A2731_00990 [Candidatus Buchananbacteria bacterium RIFCSPHIGHO2_01_FULL_39_8]|uniref:tRNA-dihydrouridine synthase n=1 Tax=Candidatus Buchananbacteria bacterium RIFCSPHIGHO2_01_FULL_39_8 TaxID=1797533 RepID=A0A1G1XY17_9BACT|nr:MAG: hypothetical protein A2731_00990 [Candidatus Buchananbacteria bacterium RIFCSPHIGHO2_01_FULL_39_8]